MAVHVHARAQALTAAAAACAAARRGAEGVPAVQAAPAEADGDAREESDPVLILGAAAGGWS